MEEKQVNRCVIIVHSGDMDKLYSALIISVGALSMGMSATLFFTFWGLERLKKAGLGKGGLSRMNFLGLGAWFMKRKMRAAKVVELEKLISDYRELGGKILACDMTMSVMGITKNGLREDLIDEYVGVGTYIQEARGAKINLFI